MYAGMNGLRSSMSKLRAAAELFEGRHFDREVIILCVRWYLRFKLSLRDLVEMMAERGLSMAHTTIMRWGAALRPGVRETLAPVWPGAGHAHWRRRDE
jgi:transposase-like protein